MPDDEDCTVCVQLLGGRKRLPRIAEVVGHDQPNLLAEHTACSIDIGNGHLRTAPKLHAGPGELTAHRASDADQDFRLSLGCKRECKCSSGEKMAHGGPSPFAFYSLRMGTATVHDGSGQAKRVAGSGSWPMSVLQRLKGGGSIMSVGAFGTRH